MLAEVIVVCLTAVVLGTMAVFVKLQKTQQQKDLDYQVRHNVDSINNLRDELGNLSSILGKYEAENQKGHKHLLERIQTLERPPVKASVMKF